jgi:outer membrane protein insertion porin family
LEGLKKSVNKAVCFLKPQVLFTALLFSLLVFDSAMAQEVKLKPAPRATKTKKIIRKKSQKKGIQSSQTANAKLSTSDKNSASGKISEIKVEGNKRLEKDVVTNRIHSELGQNLDRDKIREDIQALFSLGYFETIEVESLKTAQGLALIYRVKEKPVLSELTFEGNSEIKTEELQEASGLKAFEIFNKNKLKDGLEKMQKLYEDKGYYLAKITPVVTDIAANDQVSLLIKVEENDKVKVKKIHFIGNQKLTDDFLKGRMATQEEGYFSAISNSGQFKEDAFDRDTQIIRFLYYNQGYVKAKVDRPQVTLTPDKLGIYISIRVEEGEQYSVGDVDYAGDLLFPTEKFKETSKIQNNKVFAYDVLQKDLVELQALYGDLGYAYANVIPRTRFDDAAKRVDLVFEFDKGNKVHFGRINVIGNTKSRDKVVRRELKIKEGELYHETRRKESLENIQRLGFFEEVNFKTSTPLNQPDIMDVDIVVKERNTGQIQIGAGYSTSSGFALQGSVQQTNFRGLGQNLGVSIQFSKDYEQYDVSFTEPYFDDTDWSLGGRVFKSETSGRLDYNESKAGASIFTSHPIGEYLRAGASYTFTHTKLSAVKDTDGTSLTDPELFPLSTANGDSGLAGVYVEYDTRNDRFRPSKGMYAKLSYADSGLLGGNLKYNRAGADYRFFKNLFWDVVWRNSFSYARIEASEKGEPVPFNELYVMGGPYSLRGFRYATVGKRKYSSYYYNKHNVPGSPGYIADDNLRQIESNRVFGGSKQVLYQTELMYPMIREADMYGVLFYDVGQAEDVIIGDNLYSDWGFGIRWFSPLGPLRFEWGFPIKRDSEYHDASVFEFSIGTPF